jgi:tetratricopeptide (TPR) repeat protein
MNDAAPLMHTLRWVGIAGVILGGTSARAHQSEIANPAAREALVLCRAADGVPLSDRAKILANGLERAEKAEQEAPQDASAHFAVFCNLGKRLQLEQHTLWLLAGLNELNRARRELDVALELAPDYPAAVAAKGEMLAELPRFLGGDPREGERLLRRAVGLAPDDPQIRVMLATLLHARGQPEEARMHAAVALDILERTGPSTEVDDVRTLMARLK